jgi:hypothetical protein
VASIYYEIDGVSNVLFFDVTLDEQNVGTAEVTKHPVERGADMADHHRAAPPSFTLRAMVTNTPIESIGRLVGAWLPQTLETDARVMADGGANIPARAAQIRGGYTAPYRPPGAPRPHFPVDVIGGQLASGPQRLVAQTFTFTNPQDRLRDMWDALDKLREDGTTLTVLTRLKDYENMVITQLGAPVTVLDAIEFSISCEQITYYQSLTFGSVDRVAAAKVATKAAEAKKDQGPAPLRTITRQDKASVVALTAKAAAEALVGAPSTATVTPP